MKQPQHSRTEAPPSALVIAHEPDGPGGQIAVRLVERGFVVTTHVVNEDRSDPSQHAPFPDFEAFDMIAIMGSVYSLTKTDEIGAWVFDELELIRAAHDRDQPMLGICFGGQLLSEALGGSVESAPVTELGWVELDDGDEPNPVGPGPWMEWHHDRFTPPPTASVLARSADAEQLFTIGFSAGTQFHPEIDLEHLERWLTFLDGEADGVDYLATYGQTPERLRDEMSSHEARNTEQCHQLVDWFIDSISGLEVSGLDAATHTTGEVTE